MTINKELLKGSTATLVLTLLARKQMYGYEIIKELEIASAGIFEMKEGTLYPILHTLEENDFVESKWVGEEGTRQRKYYHITKAGRVHLKEKKQEWIQFRALVDKVVLG
ncbi:MAG: PadR family transcriptional regulator [Bdellovibrionaceae bacterium]|nr:PadR family transcriptional regulator [Pseudobdellovibrionaceae bacterium]